MSRAAPDVSVVIVSFNGREWLKRCLLSLASVHCSTEIIVVDNGSTDGSRELVTSEFPRVKLLANGNNRGFAAACNQGMRVATGRYHLLLNPDVEVPAGSVEALVEFLDSVPSAGAAACRLEYPGGAVWTSARSWPSVWVVLLESLFVASLWPANPISRRYYLSDWDHLDRRPVDWVAGACMLVRREVVREVGLLDEGFFLYCEDVDWCRRMHERGWMVWYLGDVRMVHLGGHSTKGAGANSEAVLRANVEASRSVMRYFEKHGSRTEALVVRAALVVHFAIRSLKWGLLGQLGVVASAEARFRLRWYRAVMRSALGSGALMLCHVKRTDAKQGRS